MADARTVQAGSIIDGRYQLTHRIAVGGMGEVWSSTDLALGRSVALKVLLAGHAQDEVTRLRFRAEAKAAASVSHPNVVPVFDFGEEDDESGGCIAYLVLEHVAGDSLAEVLRGAGRLGDERTLEIVAETAAGLEAAHRTGLVHRDIKPGNLLIDEIGRAHV